MSEQIMMTYLVTSFISFLLIVCTHSTLQMALMMIWLGLMAYLSLVHMLIRNFLTDVI